MDITLLQEEEMVGLMCYWALRGDKGRRPKTTESYVH